MSWLDLPLRIAFTGAHRLLKGAWFVRRPRTFGAHAIALTPERRVVLVKLRYAPGWRVPGGGSAPDEEPRAAALRELREEIGMTGHGRVRLGCEIEEAVDYKRDIAAIIIVEDVCYRPRWSWEVQEVGEFELSGLPDDLSGPSGRWIDTLRERL